MKLKNEILNYDSKLIKVVLIICFSLLSFSLIICHITPSVTYEPSIYNSTPNIFWFSVVASVFFATILIVSRIYTQNWNENILYNCSIMLVFLSYASVLSLFIIRGYYMWGMNGDPASHISYVNLILNSGYFPSNLFYPATHIFTTCIVLVSSLNLITIHKILPFFFSLLYVPSMYLFSKSILPRKSQHLLVVLASCTFLADWYLNFTPNALSNNLFPLLLFILIKVITMKDIRWRLLIVIMTLFYPIFHPVPTLAFIIILVSHPLAHTIYLLVNNNNNNNTNNNNKKYNDTLTVSFKLILIMILVIWGITWVSSFGVWTSTIRNLNILFSEESTVTYATKLTTQLNEAHNYGYNVPLHVLKTKGFNLLYIVITLLSLPIVIKKMQESKLYHLFSLYGPFLIMGVIIISLYFVNLGFGPLRLLVYITIICTIFVGFFLNYILEQISYNKKRFIAKWSAFGVILLLVGAFACSLFFVYPSPYSLSFNHQTTKSEVYGTDWLFDNKNTNLNMTGILFQPFRFADLLLTTDEKKLQKISIKKPSSLNIPYHFGYDYSLQLGSHFVDETYVVINEKDKSFYVDVFPKMAELRWTKNDFYILNNYDKTVDKIYTNAFMDIFYVHNVKGDFL